MSLFKCPYGHWLDTEVVGSEGTLECPECNRDYLERKFSRGAAQPGDDKQEGK